MVKLVKKPAHKVNPRYVKPLPATTVTQRQLDAELADLKGRFLRSDINNTSPWMTKQFAHQRNHYNVN